MNRKDIWLVVAASVCFLLSSCGMDIETATNTAEVDIEKATQTETKPTTTIKPEDNTLLSANTELYELDRDDSIMRNAEPSIKQETKTTSETNTSTLCESSCESSHSEATETADTTQPTQIVPLSGFDPGRIEDLEASISSKWALVGRTRVSDIHSIYDSSELISRIGFMRPFNTSTTYFRLNEEYPVECLNIPDSGVGYCIYKLSDGSKLIIFFDDNPGGLYHVTQMMVVNGSHTKQDYDKLSCGMTLQDVLGIDKGSEVLITNNSMSLDLGETLHIVDGGFIQIKYDNHSGNRWTYSPEDYSKFVITSVEFIPNGGFIPAPKELECDYVNGGFNYYIAEEDLFDLLN